MKVKGGKALSVVNNCLAAAVFILILVAGIITRQMFIKLLPSLISVAVYLLSARVSRFAFLVGGLNSVLYAAGFLMEGVYGSFLSAILFSFPVQIYTFFAWRKHAYKQATEFRRMKVKNEVLLGIGTAVCWAAAYFIALQIGSAKQQFFDMGVLVVGIIVQLLTAGAFMEAVVFNVINSVVNTGLWISSMAAGDIANVTYLIINLFSFYCVIISSVKWVMLYKEIKKYKSEKAEDTGTFGTAGAVSAENAAVIEGEESAAEPAVAEQTSAADGGVTAAEGSEVPLSAAAGGEEARCSDTNKKENL